MPYFFALTDLENSGDGIYDSESESISSGNENINLTCESITRYLMETKIKMSSDIFIEIYGDGDIKKEFIKTTYNPKVHGLVSKDVIERIFNIDFGYILGKDPKLLAPEFRITGEMIDAMGGIKSKYYDDFKNYCFKAYNCLRNHTNIFSVMLSLLYTLKPPIDNFVLNNKYVKSEIVKRFIPGEQYNEAAIHFKYKINTNSNTYSGNIIDYFHKKCKSDSQSVPNSNETIFNSAVNAWNATSNLTLNIGNNLKNLFWN